MRHGFLLIDKPCGPSSHDVVQAVRKRLNERSIGHLGTLDPLASGLLVLAVGTKALKVIELFKDLPKTYEAECTFGFVSTTYDRGGVLENVPLKPGVPVPDRTQVRRMIDARFRGMIIQTPPAHSAVHVGGVRAYELARRGEQVILQQRSITVSRCDIVSYNYPVLRLTIECSAGTYIRSLAHDLGQVLRVGAYLSALRRTRVGEWSVDNAVMPTEAAWKDVLPLKNVLTAHPKIDVSDQAFDDIVHGRTVRALLKEETIAWHNGLPVAILIPSDASPGFSRPRKVF